MKPMMYKTLLKIQDIERRNESYTTERYAAALRGEEYACIKSQGVVELGELCRMTSEQDGTNRDRLGVANAPITPVQSIDLCIA